MLTHRNKFYVSIALTLCLFVVSQAQTAKVIVLSQSDAAEAKRLHDEMKAANERWEAFQKRVTRVYTAGVPSGFEFDETFRFMLPRSTSTGTITIGGCSPPYIYSTPAVGNIGLSTMCAGSACGSAIIKN